MKWANQRDLNYHQVISEFFAQAAKQLQYCAKVMQAIIVEYRENRDISAIFNAN